jgi:hypothetical protein
MIFAHSNRLSQTNIRRLQRRRLVARGFATMRRRSNPLCIFSNSRVYRRDFGRFPMDVSEAGLQLAARLCQWGERGRFHQRTVSLIHGAVISQRV